MKETVLTKGEKVHGTVESIVRRINKNERKKSKAGKKGSSETVRAESGEVSDRIQE